MSKNRVETFDTDLVIQYDREASQLMNKDYWRVVHAFKFSIEINGQIAEVPVHEGFLTDGASVPRPFWWLLPPWGVYGQAAVMHDLLCETGYYYVHGVKIEIPRARADWMFREAMKQCGVSYAKRTIMYWGVRLFTGLHMRLHRDRYVIKDRLEASRAAVAPAAA